MTKTYNFAFFFDATNSNPNGDPDAGNLPRMDPETMHGLMTDVSIKRKIRNYVGLTRGEDPGHGIYVQEGNLLNEVHQKAYDAQGIKATSKKLPKDKDEAKAITSWLCENYFDIRTFGAVMTTEVNGGAVRGPVQLEFSKTVEPVFPLEVAITRCAATNEKDRNKERTIGRKHVIPYGMFMVKGYVNGCFAEKSGFSDQDLETLWAALRDMFEFDRSAARAGMTARDLIVFEHESKYGNAQTHKLFDRISVKRLNGADEVEVGDPRSHNWAPARAFTDYRIDLNDADLPGGVTVHRPWV